MLEIKDLSPWLPQEAIELLHGAGDQRALSAAGRGN